jgi:hypothetical protein
MSTKSKSPEALFKPPEPIEPSVRPMIEQNIGCLKQILTLASAGVALMVGLAGKITPPAIVPISLSLVAWVSSILCALMAFRTMVRFQETLCDLDGYFKLYFERGDDEQKESWRAAVELRTPQLPQILVSFRRWGAASAVAFAVGMVALIPAILILILTGQGR